MKLVLSKEEVQALLAKALGVAADQVTVDAKAVNVTVERDVSQLFFAPVASAPVAEIETTTAELEEVAEVEAEQEKPKPQARRTRKPKAKVEPKPEPEPEPAIEEDEEEDPLDDIDFM